MRNAALGLTRYPLDFTTLEHIALNLTCGATGKDSIHLKGEVGACRGDFLGAITTA